jgi:hypothetical protein
LKTEKAIFILLFLGIALTIISTIRFETESVPDLVVTRHGFPSSWLHHQTVSITGVVDVWSVQWLFLVVDFIFWYFISATIVYFVNRYRN